MEIPGRRLFVWARPLMVNRNSGETPNFVMAEVPRAIAQWCVILVCRMWKSWGSGALCLLRKRGRRQLCLLGMGGRWGRSPVGAVGVWLLVVIAPICQMMIVAV